MRFCLSLHSWLWNPGFWLAHRLHQPESGSLLPMRSHVPEGPSCSEIIVREKNQGRRKFATAIGIRNIQLWFLYTLIERFWHWWVVPVLFGSERTTWRSKTFEWPSNWPLESREVWERVNYVLIKTVWIGYFVILSYSGFHARQTSRETRWKVTSIWQSAGIFPSNTDHPWFRYILMSFVFYKYN